MKNTPSTTRVPMTRSKIAALKVALGGGGGDNKQQQQQQQQNSDNDFSNSSFANQEAQLLQLPIVVPKRNKPPAFRCVCSRPVPPIVNNNYGLDCVQCQKCHHALHAQCVGLVRPEKTSSRSERDAATLLLETFVCNFCLKESGGQIGGVKLQNQNVFSVANGGGGQTKGGGRRKTQSQLNAAVTGKQRRNNNSLAVSSKVGAVAVVVVSTNQSNINSSQEDPEFDLQKILSIKECPDRPILNAEPFRKIIKNGADFLTSAGYKLVLFPSSSSPSATGFTNEQIEDQVLECSRSSIEDATFSEEYPLYCVREMLSKKHPYLQGAAAVDNKTKKIVAIAMSNGRDPYCDLRATVENLKRQITSPKGKVKLLSTPAEESKYAANFVHHQQQPKERISFNAKTGIVRQREETVSNSPTTSFSITTSVTTDPKTSNLLYRNQAAQFAKQCVDFFKDSSNNSLDSIVHFTYIVTHDQHRGKKLAKTLMWIEMARWALRGRTNACVNMALEKVYHHYSVPIFTTITTSAKVSPKISGQNVPSKAKQQQQQQLQVLHQTRPQFLVDDDDEEELINNNSLTSNIRLMGGSEHHHHQTANNNNNNTTMATTTNNSKKKNGSKIIDVDEQQEESDEEDTVLECRITDASRKLYTGLSFQEVFPRYNSDGTLRWTRKEENAGRMMVSLDFPAKMLSVLNPK